MPKRLPSVVIVGRPNVGKSTLFNRLTGSRRAIVTATPGTTRDVITKPVVWRGVTFELTDTGGIFGFSEDPLCRLVVEQGRPVIAAADFIIFLVDGADGCLPDDAEIARALRPVGVPVILVINKADDKRTRDSAMGFYQLGFEPVLEVSAEHGQGTGDLLDEIVRQLSGSARPLTADEGGGQTGARGAGPSEAQPEEVGVAIVGRPNVGKSSLVNRLLKEERVLVSEMPGTTRDAVDAVLTWHRRQFRIVDTAGIRRPGRVAASGQVEAVSVVVARRAIEQADIAVIVIDATEGATDQDAAIAGEADRAGRGVIIAVNKWDLVKGKGAEAGKTFDEDLRRHLKFLDYAPMLHVSAVTGERTAKLLELIDQVADARKRRVPTAALNKFIEAITSVHPPASPGRRHVRILYAAQVGIAPPSFVFFTNVATTFHFSYERFVVNQLRESFGFAGTPIRLEVRARKQRGQRATAS